MGQIIFPMSEKYQEYLIDESKYTGEAVSISFPESEEEILAVLEEMKRLDMRITIQGGKTGITGGSVPNGGHILNVSRMNQVKDSWICADGTGRIVAEPGLNLMDLNKEITARFRKENLFWPVEPTESSATIGGIAATGAQGITRPLYGDGSRYVAGLKAVDGNGRRIELTEKEELGAFLGKEGITGVITELTLILLKRPEEVWGILFFFEDEMGAMEFVEGLRELCETCEDGKIASAEYLDQKVLSMIGERKNTMNKIRELPDVEPGVSGAVYVEIHGTEDGIEHTAETLMELAAEHGSDPDMAWAVSGETEVEKLHAFRHAAPETCNLFVEEAHQRDARITKLGTDMRTEGQGLAELIAGYRKDLGAEGLKGCIFGHALENHFHINLLPETYEEYMAGIGLICKWAEDALKEKGTVFEEHGVGKLKGRILEDIQGEYFREQGRTVKAVFDPEGIFNPGNRFMP